MKLFSVSLLLLTTQISIHGSESLARVQDYRDEIDSLLNKLLLVEKTVGKDIVIKGPSSKTQRHVTDRLLQIADYSPEARLQVIDAMIHVLEKPPSEERSAIAYRWTTAVHVLSYLRATEAIDILVKNLDQTGENGIMSSLHYRPVASALDNIGEPAVPRLIEALSDENPDICDEAASTLARIGKRATEKLKEAIRSGNAKTKIGVALALARIGGEEATAIIDHAIEVETDLETLSKLMDAREESRLIWGK